MQRSAEIGCEPKKSADLRELVERELGPAWRAPSDGSDAGEAVAWMLDGVAIDYALERDRIRREAIGS